VSVIAAGHQASTISGRGQYPTVVQFQSVLAAFNRNEKDAFFGQHKYHRIAQKIHGDTSRIRFDLTDFFNVDGIFYLLGHLKAALSDNNELFHAQSSPLLRKGRDAIGEEEVGNFLDRSGQEPLAELRDFATNLRLRAIAEIGAFGDVGEHDRCIALGETGDPPCPSPTIV
jgi:hypothetical protein